MSATMSASAEYLAKAGSGDYGEDRLFLAEQLRRLVPMDLDEWAFYAYLDRSCGDEEAARGFAVLAAVHGDAVTAAESFLHAAGYDVERERYLDNVSAHRRAEQESSWDEALRPGYSASAELEKRVAKLAERVASGQPLRWM